MDLTAGVQFLEGAVLFFTTPIKRKEVFSSGVKRPDIKDDHSPQSCMEVKLWSC